MQTKPLAIRGHILLKKGKVMAGNVFSIPMISFDSATLSGTYQTLNPLGIPEACYMIRLINKSNVDIIISYNSVDNNDYILAGTTVELTSQPNSQTTESAIFLGRGGIVYLKQATAPGVGLVYLAGYFQN